MIPSIFKGKAGEERDVQSAINKRKVIKNCNFTRLSVDKFIVTVAVFLM